MAERQSQEQLQKLINQGIEVYSISRLNTFESCEYSYYLSYILKQKGFDNVYSITGSKLHDCIEQAYNGAMKSFELEKAVDDTMLELDMLDINFPTESIKNSWVKDIKHFCQNFKVMDGIFVTEEFVLFEIIDGIWIQGYVDIQKLNEDGSLDIYDWKSSSKFAKKDLLKYGRQLVLYTIGKEREGLKVNNVGWYMLKYCDVHYKVKGKEKVKKAVNRSKWISEMQDKIKKELIDNGEHELIAEDMIAQAIMNNSLDNMPKHIQENYTLTDCLVVYEVTDELKEELINYITNTVTKIRAKNNSTNELDWKPVAIDKNNNFFCSNLCNHRKTCKYLKAYLDTVELEPKENSGGIEDLFK